MSTKHLQEVVRAAKTGIAVDGIVADKALLELHALKRAAVVIAATGIWYEPGQHNPKEAADAHAIMVAIAKEEQPAAQEEQ